MDKVKRTFLEYWKGSRAYATLLNLTTRGRDVFCPQEEAEERAAVCVGCPFNLEPGKVEAVTDSLAKRMTDGRVTSVDGELRNCDVCSCPLKVMVHIDGGILQSLKSPMDLLKRARKRQKQTGKQIPANCWQMKFYNVKP